MNQARPKLLLIDDSVDMLDLLELYCYKEFEVYTAGNGFEGLKMAQEILPDLIITDIMMPGVDGIRLLNDLRRTEKTASIPVVALTSFVRKITRKSLLNMGFSDVVAKPVERERLLAAVTHLISLSSTHRNRPPSDETTS